MFSGDFKFSYHHHTKQNHGKVCCSAPTQYIYYQKPLVCWYISQYHMKSWHIWSHTHQSEMRLLTLPCSKPPTQALLGFTQRIGWQTEILWGKRETLIYLNTANIKCTYLYLNLGPLGVHRCHLDLEEYHRN